MMPWTLFVALVLVALVFAAIWGGAVADLRAERKSRREDRDWPPPPTVPPAA